jgi:hypothetical protein
MLVKRRSRGHSCGAGHTTGRCPALDHLALTACSGPSAAEACEEEGSRAEPAARAGDDGDRREDQLRRPHPSGPTGLRAAAAPPYGRLGLTGLRRARGFAAHAGCKRRGRGQDSGRPRPVSDAVHHESPQGNVAGLFYPHVGEQSASDSRVGPWVFLATHNGPLPTTSRMFNRLLGKTGRADQRRGIVRPCHIRLSHGLGSDFGTPGRRAGSARGSSRTGSGSRSAHSRPGRTGTGRWARSRPCGCATCSA